MRSGDAPARRIWTLLEFSRTPPSFAVMRRTPPTRWAFTATADAMVTALIVLKDTENEYPA